MWGKLSHWYEIYLQSLEAGRQRNQRLNPDNGVIKKIIIPFPTLKNPHVALNKRLQVNQIKEPWDFITAALCTDLPRGEHMLTEGSPHAVGWKPGKTLIFTLLLHLKTYIIYLTQSRLDSMHNRMLWQKVFSMVSLACFGVLSASCLQTALDIYNWFHTSLTAFRPRTLPLIPHETLWPEACIKHKSFKQERCHFLHCFILATEEREDLFRYSTVAFYLKMLIQILPFIPVIVSWKWIDCIWVCRW